MPRTGVWLINRSWKIGHRLAMTGSVATTRCPVWCASMHGPSATVNCSRSAMVAASLLAPIGIRIVGAVNMLMPAPAIGSTLVQAFASRVGNSSGPAIDRSRNRA
jgi:hypothetical protein